jgi:hypothetical protein
LPHLGILSYFSWHPFLVTSQERVPAIKTSRVRSLLGQLHAAILRPAFIRGIVGDRFAVTEALRRQP